MQKIHILHTSPRTSSISHELAENFAEKLRTTFGNVAVSRRDLAIAGLSNLDADGLAVLRSTVEGPSPAQQAVLALSDEMIDEIEAADLLLVSAPMHNFTVPATMRTWLDYITRPGRTFGYSEGGPKGLLADKPVVVISSRGGQYGTGAADAPNPYDFQSGYLRHIFGFIGLSQIEIIAANGMDMGDEPRTQGLAEAAARIDEVITILAHNNKQAA